MTTDYTLLEDGDEFKLDGIGGTYVVDRIETTYTDYDTEEYRCIYLVDGRWFMYYRELSPKLRKYTIVSRGNQCCTLGFDLVLSDEELDRREAIRRESEEKDKSKKSGLAKLTDAERRALGLSE